MPFLSEDGSVTFVALDRDEMLLEKKMGLVLKGTAAAPAGFIFAQAKASQMPVPSQKWGPAGLHFGPSKSKSYCEYVGYSDDARQQILETIWRKGITAVVPTTSVGLPPVTSQDTAASTPDIEAQRLLERVKFLEAQLRSSLPYLQMYKFGAGSLLVAVISLLAWLLTGTGAPFHPVFAVMVIPVAIGLMVMAFLVRRDIPNSRSESKR